MAHYSEQYPYLEHLLGAYFHQDCYDFGDTNEDILNDYVESNWPHQRLGLRADIERFLHAHPDDAFEAMTKRFSMSAYPQLDNMSMAKWLREVALRLKSLND
jgi:hypothetical protein